MAIRLTCSCGATLSVGEHREGSEVKCPKCRSALLIAGDADNDQEADLPAEEGGLLPRVVLLGLAMALTVVLAYLMFRRD